MALFFLNITNIYAELVELFENASNAQKLRNRKSIHLLRRKHRNQRSEDLYANLHDHVPEEYTTKNHNRSPCLISRIFISCEIVFKTFRL